MHNAIVSMSRSFLPALVSLAVVSGGCASSGEESARPDRTSQRALTENALTENALTENALTENALTENALTENALTENALTENALTENALTDPDAQTFLKYLIRVAFRPDQCETFQWTDPQTGAFPSVYCGTLALCPQWQTGGISGDLACQEWVTAGLLAHVNATGAGVTFSARAASAPLDVVSEYEAHEFRFREGAFWGNLFADPRELYAAPDLHNATIAKLQARLCTDPSSPCSITVVGPVDAESAHPQTEQGWSCESTSSTKTWDDASQVWSTETDPTDTANLIETGDEVVSDCHSYLMTPGYAPTAEELAAHTSRVVTTYLTEPGVQTSHGCSASMHPTPSGVCAP